jgi:hypothetical protein
MPSIDNAPASQWKPPQTLYPVDAWGNSGEPQQGRSYDEASEAVASVKFQIFISFTYIF